MLSTTPQIIHLDVAWKMLRARIIWILVMSDKYDSEYQGLPINSPATTNPKIYNLQPTQALNSTGSQLLGLMRDIPYVVEAAMKRQKRRIVKGRHFKEIWDVLDQLTVVFPHCNTKTDPCMISYDQFGNVIACP